MLILIIIILKIGLIPLYADPEMPTEAELVLMSEYEARLESYNNVQSKLATWTEILTGYYVDVINEERSPVIIKDGKEYLLATLRKQRVVGDLPSSAAVKTYFANMGGFIGLTDDVPGWLSSRGFTYPESGE